MMEEVLDLLQRRHLPNVPIPDLPANIAKTDRPPKKDVVVKHKTRIQRRNWPYMI